VPADLPTKLCAGCGRPFTWRRRWAAVWDEVRWCSDRCRGVRVRRDDRWERAVLEVLAGRSEGATACPSEVARREAPDAWREHMEDVRQAAARLVAEGLVEVTQGGRVVELAQAKGPVRLRRTRR
jgi:hypothetical protein